MLVFAGLAAMLALALAACASEADDEKPTLIFSDLNWSTALLQNAVAREILEKGYDYETDSVAGGTIPLMQALTAGDTNITMEIWLPNQQAAWQEATAAGTVAEIGNSLAGVAWQSAFLIPQYTADANPGLRSVEDLKDEANWSLFVRPDSEGKAGLITCIPGWECEVVNEKQVHGYGLADNITLINPGSYEGLNAEILSAFERNEDILFYYWGPETLPAKLNQYGGFHRLQEPPNSAACWDHMSNTENAEDIQQACQYSDAQVLIAVRAELIESASDAVAFLAKWTMSDDSIYELLGRLDETGDEYADVAAWWLQNNDEWKAWVGEGIADKVLEAL